MNIDEKQLAAAITERTRAVVPVHYAGVACAMDTISAVAETHRLWVVEDAAQAMLASYRGRALGSIGQFGCLSFHETKGYTAGGEGGALLINHPDFVARAEIVREKGTDRAEFWRGNVDKYTWRDIGSSHLMSELQAAYLRAQLESAKQIDYRRGELWDGYAAAFEHLVRRGKIEVQHIPPEAHHNAHMFYLKLRDAQQRNQFITAMRAQGIMAVFHYVPLHSSPAGRRFGRFHGSDVYTTAESQRLVRLPLFYNMTDEQHRAVIDAVLGCLD